MNTCKNCKFSCYEEYKGKPIIVCSHYDIGFKTEQKNCELWEEQA